jgi:hypothetical protein
MLEMTARACWFALLVVSAPEAWTQTQEARVNPDAKAIASFQQAVEDYLALHKKLESTLPPLPKETTPEAIDKHERALERLIQLARRGATVGLIFNRDVRPLFRKLLHGIFNGPNGKQVRASMMEENPGPAVTPVVNGRYPDTIPLSSVPPQVLRALPPLPEELEYRFIGDKLILLDRHAHIVVDYLPGAVPR